MDPVATTCPYCGVGCGVSVESGPDGVAPVSGDRAHPANAGRLCVKGSSLHETLGQRGRVTRPVVRGQEVSWDSAIEFVADQLRQRLEKDQAHRLGFYLSGQLLTEDYYVANKLAKGFLGTPHVDTNSRLCMSSAVAAHKRAFGEDVVPGCYEDLEQAELLVFVGANPAWNHPVLYQRMKQALDDHPERRLVVIDPRRTASCERADLHLPLRPGSDALLWNGLLVWLDEQGAVDQTYLNDHCQGWDETLAAARADAPNLAAVAAGCDLDEADIKAFYQWFAQTPRTVSLWSQGLNQSSSGSDKGNALINCHLATGRVGKPGASPFSITGQPNAMGGREVGGLANQLAAHMDYSTPGAVEAVQAFWRAPAQVSEPGYKAVELFEAVHEGEMDAVWIMATNPVVSLPDANRVKEALARCPLVIVSECMANAATLEFADVILPAQGWSEKDGTVTNSERCISRQRRIAEPVPEARPDWWIITEVARALGFESAFDYRSAADIFREHAQLTGLNQGSGRQLDLTGLQSLTDDAYEQLSPIQWPVVADSAQGTARVFSNGRFATPNGRANLIPVHSLPPEARAQSQAPWMINSGRLRDQWHTMTRTGRASRLLQHHSEPFVAMHPEDVKAEGLGPGQLIWCCTNQGRYLGRLLEDSGQRRGELFVPIHWNSAFSGQAVAGELYAGVTDPLSGQPESKQVAGWLEPFDARWEARLLCADDEPGEWSERFWVRVPGLHSTIWHLAGREPVANWEEEVTGWLNASPDAEMSDPAVGRYRAAWYQDGRLRAVLLVEPVNDFPQLDWLDGLFDKAELDGKERSQVLAGRAADVPDQGVIVCSCFQVGEHPIRAAIQEGCHSTEALGKSLKCGTNCGSCIPELKQMLDVEQSEASAL